MNLSNAERAAVEQALDELALAATMTPRLSRLYERAAAIVRERPVGTRRVRSDFNGRRVPAAQIDFVEGA